MNSMYDHKRAFQSYLAKTTEKDIFAKEFSQRFQVNVKKPAALADLGCHDGTLTLRLLALVDEKLPDGSVIACIDPSREALDSFRSKLLPTKFRFTFHDNTAEQFFSKSSEKFDWIIASHCLYWSPQLKDVIGSICNRSTNAVIVLRGRRGIYQIQSEFKDWVGNSNEQFFTADDVESALIDGGFSFSRNDIVSTISIPEGNDPILPFIVAFFLQTQPEHISPLMLSKVHQFIKNMGTDLTHDVSFFWTTK